MRYTLQRIFSLIAVALLAVACGSESEILPPDTETTAPKEETGIEYADLESPDSLAWGPPGIFTVDEGYAVPDNLRGRIVLFDEEFNLIREIDVHEYAVGIIAVAQYDGVFFGVDIAPMTPKLVRIRGDEVRTFDITVASKAPPSGLMADEVGLVLEYGGGEHLYRAQDDGEGFVYAPIEGYTWNGDTYAVEAATAAYGHERTLRFRDLSVPISVPNHLGSMQVMGPDGEGGVLVLVEDVQTSPVVTVEQTVVRVDAAGAIRATARIPLEDRLMPVWRGVTLDREHNPVALIPGKEGLRFRSSFLRDPSGFLETDLQALPDELEDVLTEAVEPSEFGTLRQPLYVAGGGCLTPAQMVSNANEYGNVWTYLSSTSINNNGACSGRTKPAYLGSAGYYSSVSYNWGGFNTPSEFVSGMASNLKAGNLNTSYVLTSCAKGVDCSGFVSRVWGRTNKLSTSSIPSYVKPYTPVLTAGDVLNKANDHVVVFAANATNGIYAYESTHYQNLDRVAYTYRPWSTLSGYTAYRSATSCL